MLGAGLPRKHHDLHREHDARRADPRAASTPSLTARRSFQFAPPEPPTMVAGSIHTDDFTKRLEKWLVGAAGIEPATICSQSRYATAALRPVRPLSHGPHNKNTISSNDPARFDSSHA